MNVEKKSRADLVVACNTNRKFLPDCAVMLRSLSQQNSKHPLRVYLLHDGSLTTEELKHLGACLHNEHQWHPLQLHADQIKDFPDAKIYGGATACFRLLLPEVLPQHQRVLYLDADTMVRGDLAELWQTPMEGFAVAAVTNPLFTHMWRRIQSDFQLEQAHQYFNSGVLLLNLSFLRETQLDKALLQFARQPPRPIPWPDQDSLNAVLFRFRYPLAPRYNALPGIFFRAKNRLPWDHDVIEQAQHAPLIVHFAGLHKPWHIRCHSPFKEEYFRYLAQTVWADRKSGIGSFSDHVLAKLPTAWGLHLEDFFKQCLLYIRRWRRTARRVSMT